MTIAILLSPLALAGCLSDDDAANPEHARSSVERFAATEAADANGPSVALNPPRLMDGIVHLDVAVPVVLVGYSENVAQDLDQRLSNQTVHQWTSSGDPFLFSSDPVRPPETNGAPYPRVYDPGPLSTTGVYHVWQARDAFVSDVRAVLAGSGPTANATQVESLLVDTLRQEPGLVNANRPLIVLIDSDALAATDVSWTYHLPYGLLDDVVVFGERHPMLVVDAPADADAMVERIHRATEYRLLQGNNARTPIASCHALTVIQAWRTASPLDDLEDPTDRQEVRAAFEALTGDETHVDFRAIDLPADDPVLDALSRADRQPNGFSEPLLREWVIQNWDDYWVAHDGCRGYVSILFQEAPTLSCLPVRPSGMPRCGNFGVGTYDDGRDYRIALSWIYGDSPMANTWLHVHEGGHLFGLNHPHNIHAGPDGETNETFTTVWSSMSYDTISGGESLVHEFSAIDRANFVRNQAGFVVQAAAAAGLEDTAEFQAALDHLADYEWKAASDALRPLLETQPTELGGTSR